MHGPTSSSPAERVRSALPWATCALVAGAALVVLLWSRLAGLDQSLWFDEAYTVEVYVEPGPGAVFFATYLPNNHMLFSLLAWAAARVAGASEVVYRLWSVVPALLGGLGVSAWLLRRHGAAAALAFLLLWTAAPIVTDLSRQARGYGLVFAGMSVLLVAAAHAARTGWSRRTFSGCVLGALVGTLSQPVFVLPVVGVVMALLAVRRTRRAAWWLPLATGLPTLLWYLPVLGDLVDSSGQQFGEPLAWHALVTEPVQAFGFTEQGVAFTAGALWSVVVTVLVVAGSAWTWRHSRGELLVIALPVAVTLGVLTATRLYAVPRFLSFLFVPCAVLAAVGVHAVARWSSEHAGRVLPLAAATGVGATALLLVSALPGHRALVELPREAHQEVGAFVDGRPGRIVSNTVSDIAYAHYVSRPVDVLSNDDIESLACTEPGRLIVIERAVRDARLEDGCLRARGERTRFRQRAGVGHVDVWVLDAAPPS